MKVRIALAALAGVATLATVGVAATATSASASTIPTSVSRITYHISYAPRGCPGSQLSATLTSGYQNRHNRELVLTLTNAGSTACNLSGYPGLQLLNSRYQPLPTAVVQVPGRTSWSGPTVLLPGLSLTADITFAVSGPYYPGGNQAGLFYQGSAAYLVVTLPGYPVSGPQPLGPPYQQPSGQIYRLPYGQRFVLAIPSGPVRIVQDRLYETPLMGYFAVTW